MLRAQEHKSIRDPIRVLYALLTCALLIGWLFIIYTLQKTIDKTRRRPLRELLVEEMMYFPSGNFLRPTVIEFENIAADLVWLRAIQYYGHHLMTDKKFEWLGHIFEILTNLDHRFINAYHFGAITLAWDAREVEEAIRLLRKGMADNLLDWQLPFDVGFINFILKDDYSTAGYYFQIAGKLPNAWFITQRWAAYAYGKAKKFETARQLWIDIFNSTDNKKLQELTLKNLRKLQLDEDLNNLQTALNRFFADNRTYPKTIIELVNRGYIKNIPKEPFGGRYVIRGDKIQTTTPPKVIFQ